MEYNEQKAIMHIRNSVPAELLAGVDDDEILNLIDIMFDYYDEKGLLDFSLDIDDIDDAGEDVDEADLIAYVKKMIAKDKHSPIKLEAVEPMVKAELDYEASIEEEI